MRDFELLRAAAHKLTDACEESANPPHHEQYSGPVKVEAVRIIGGHVNWVVIAPAVAASLARFLRIQSNVEQHDPGTASKYLLAVARDILAAETTSGGND